MRLHTHHPPRSCKEKDCFAALCAVEHPTTSTDFRNLLDPHSKTDVTAGYIASKVKLRESRSSGLARPSESAKCVDQFLDRDVLGADQVKPHENELSHCH